MVVNVWASRLLVPGVACIGVAYIQGSYTLFMQVGDLPVYRWGIEHAHFEASCHEATSSRLLIPEVISF